MLFLKRGVISVTSGKSRDASVDGPLLTAAEMDDESAAGFLATIKDGSNGSALIGRSLGADWLIGLIDSLSSSSLGAISVIFDGVIGIT